MFDKSVLVARAMPGALPKDNKPDDVDILAADLKKITVTVKSLVNKTAPIATKLISNERRSKSGDAISPTDFITLQSLRSSAMARKTNTTSKFSRNGVNLFADLLATNDIDVKPSEEKPKAENATLENDVKIKLRRSKLEEKPEKTLDSTKKEPEKDETCENAETKTSSDLLARGPIKATRLPTNYQPYPSSGSSSSRYGMMALQVVPQGPQDPSNYKNGNYYYSGSDYYPVVTPATLNPWLNYREIHSNSSTPDTVYSDMDGYGSSAYSPQYQAAYGVDQKISKEGFDSILNANNSQGTNSELPDAISDFILQYSRRYTDKQQQKSKDCKSSTGSQSPQLERPGSTDSGCDSPLSAGSAPHDLPAHPSSGISGPSTPTSDPRFQSRTDRTMIVRSVNPNRRAKERFRTMIKEEDMDEAWVWTCRFIQEFPGVICYQDNDKDSLLHIVTHHMDLAKIFTLVEQMLKTEHTGLYKPFDMPNRMNETPLFLSVERRRVEVVDYLLEVGANPNTQTSRPERDAPLHYAASRGMTDIVQVLCSYSTTNINLMNGMRLTPLLCAVKNHGVLDEATQCIIDNKAVIQSLLKYGADSHITDITNGKSTIHYAVERMDPEVIEIFKANLDEEFMTSLVNKSDLCSETPMQTLTSLKNLDENTRSALCLRLVTCGASMNTSPSPSN